VRRLIVNADDFALTPGVTAGILDAHAAGTVTAASMFVHGPGWDDGVRAARATPTLDIGLHFNLLVGTPLTPAPSLRAAGGGFATLSALVRRAVTHRIRAREVEAECEAQLDALAAAGIRVTHVDSHRHTHALPVVRRAVARVAAARGLVLRRPVESARWAPFSPRSQLHRAAVGASWALTSPGAARPRTADHFAGVSLQGAPDPATFARGLHAFLDRLPPGTTELMVHPGRADPSLAAIDAYTSPREYELAVLRTPELSDRIRSAEIALVGFDVLQAP
jgi:predicted glycoside hydrolase/deacetylase ChbG (UPF0249 family)